MELLTVNLAAGTRRVQRDGRQYLIANATMIVPGVLNGNQGPGLYRLDVIGQNLADWDGMPALLYHPQSDDGKPISGRDARVIANQGLGFVQNAKIKGKLVAECWFDVERLRDKAPAILNALEEGKPVELSTGLSLEREDAPPGSVYNQRPYKWIATKLKPDHLAILPDQYGACSVNDGCGVLVNQQGKDMKETIDWLIANCECWNEADRETLGTFPESKLVDLKQVAEKSKQREAVHNAVTKAFTDRGGNAHQWNPITQSWESSIKEAPKQEPKQEPTPVINQSTTQTVPQVQEPKKPTAQEWLAAMPQELQPVWNNAQQALQRERDDLLNQLVANVDETAKPGLMALLQNKSPDELRSLLALKSVTGTEQTATQTQNYAGLPPVINGQRHKHNAEDVLPLPVMNYGS